MPLIHDDTLASRVTVPTWADWFTAAGVKDADVSRGLRFNGADHALDATVEGAGVLLAHDVLAYDDLRTGRLVIPFALTLRTGRAYHFVCPKQDRERPVVRAFRAWVKDEVAALDWTKWRRGLSAPRQEDARMTGAPSRKTHPTPSAISACATPAGRHRPHAVPD